MNPQNWGWPWSRLGIFLPGHPTYHPQFPAWRASDKCLTTAANPRISNRIQNPEIERHLSNGQSVMICISPSKSRRAICLLLRLFSGSVTTHSSGVKQHETTLLEKEKRNNPVAYTWETQKLIICMYVYIHIIFIYI